LDKGAYRKVRLPPPRRPVVAMVAVRDFSGLISSAWAMARAAAIAPIVSLDRCMATLHGEDVKADGARFRTLGPHPMPDRLPGILRHHGLELRLGGLMLKEGRSGPSEGGGKLRPGIGRAHVDDPHRLDPGPRSLDPEQARRLAVFHTAPELLLGCEQEVLVEGIGR